MLVGAQINRDTKAYFVVTEQKSFVTGTMWLAANRLLLKIQVAMESTIKVATETAYCCYLLGDMWHQTPGRLHLTW